MLESTDGDGVKTYQHFYEALTSHNGVSKTTVHVITTPEPMFDTTFDYGSYAMTGKMRTYNLDGTLYCMDDYLNEGIDTKDCWYDVRIMGMQPLCPKKRHFFDVANHADVMVSIFEKITNKIYQI